ncbi:uncharacterized protein HMPREF1541_05785 [Cyphellophora europaea CBS 101466]|uniref:Maltose/galactoside acetyltransferase domain-containing protein n=1 Tax=Cyphellophora europaea (strain CBS 101466) TaxID=1220924 RepID=W2RV29_CYPE1|nr:uncharacterized protein HMPREF1541_05785 [Cyphellophora europaea CBS 101466]ETN39559.1 hypothetical protein HMPREF1541_05785 [Cyphellophora europaea CBS 101466]
MMTLADSLEWQKCQRGELYVSFSPELIQARDRCASACQAFNFSTDSSRRNRVGLWRKITGDERPLPLPTPGQATDDDLFVDDPWVEAPVRADYGVNVMLSPGVFLNHNATFVDSCPIRIGARTLIGPHCSFFSGTHPLDPAVRNGTAGPETGKDIDIGEDCWLGGNVIVLPGVTIGRGSTVGAGSVVTRDVPPFHLVAGNPARILKKITSTLDAAAETQAPTKENLEGAEVAMSKS